MRNQHAHWQQGQFIDMPKYKHMSDEWKEERRSEEKLLVRPFETGNAICKATSEEEAIWIAKRLNLAANIESIITGGGSPASKIKSIEEALTSIST